MGPFQAIINCYVLIFKIELEDVHHILFCRPAEHYLVLGLLLIEYHFKTIYNIDHNENHKEQLSCIKHPESSTIATAKS